MYEGVAGLGKMQSSKQCWQSGYGQTRWTSYSELFMIGITTTTMCVFVNEDDIIVQISNPQYSCNALDCWSTGWVIYPAPGAWFITKLISVAKVAPAQYSLTMQNRGLKQHSFHFYTWYSFSHSRQAVWCQEVIKQWLGHVLFNNSGMQYDAFDTIHQWFPGGSYHAMLANNGLQVC